MKRPVLSTTLAAVCLLLVFLSNSTISNAAKAQLMPERVNSAALTTSPAGTSTVNLNNRNWNRLSVEARIGDNPNPESNRSLGTRTLSRGETWPIQSQGEDIWYRRETDPDHPNGQWTVWTHRPCYPNLSETYNENL